MTHPIEDGGKPTYEFGVPLTFPKKGTDTAFYNQLIYSKGVAMDTKEHEFAVDFVRCMMADTDTGVQGRFTVNEKFKDWPSEKLYELGKRVYRVTQDDFDLTSECCVGAKPVKLPIP